MLKELFITTLLTTASAPLNSANNISKNTNKINRSSTTSTVVKTATTSLSMNTDNDVLSSTTYEDGLLTQGYYYQLIVQDTEDTNNLNDTETFSARGYTYLKVTNDTTNAEYGATGYIDMFYYITCDNETTPYSYELIQSGQYGDTTYLEMTFADYYQGYVYNSNINSFMTVNPSNITFSLCTNFASSVSTSGISIDTDNDYPNMSTIYTDNQDGAIENIENGYYLKTRIELECLSDTYIAPQDILSYTSSLIETVDITYKYQVEIESSQYEVIDLPTLIFTILGLPFAWISTAFNLTIFEGTPYSLNISNLFLAVIAVLIFIWIIKKVLK